MTVAAVIPTLNESETVAEVVAESRRYTDTVVVVDGGSTDGTPERAEAAGAQVIRLGGRGKGMAVRHALQTVSCDVIVFIDADGSHAPESIPALLQPIEAEEADLVIGSRASGGSDELGRGLNHTVRLWGSNAIQAAVNLRFRTRLTDIQNGLRAVRTAVVRRLPLRENGFCIEQEMAVQALRHRLRVVNVPCHEFRRRHGASRLNVWLGWPSFAWSLGRLLLCPGVAPEADEQPASGRACSAREAWLAAAGALMLWAAAFVVGRRCPQTGLWLEWLGPISWAVACLSLLASAVAARRPLARLLGVLDRREWMALAALLVLTCGWRLAVVPAGEQLYYDEHAYLQMARGIGVDGRLRAASAVLPDDGALRCEQGAYPHWPAGWPALLAGVGVLLGDVRAAGPAANLALSMAAIVVVALLARSWLGAGHGWFLAAAWLAVLPVSALWSRTSSAEVSAAVGLGLAVLCAQVFVAEPGPATGVLLASAASVAAQLRNEAIVVVPLAALVIWLLGPGRGERHAVVPTCVPALLLIGHVAHLGFVSVGYDPALVSGSGLAAAYVSPNARSLSGYLVQDTAVWPALLAAGLGAWLRRGRWVVVLGGWLLLVVTPPLLHFGGSYLFPGGSRFAVLWMPPLAILAGCGLGRISEGLVARKYTAVALVAVVAPLAYGLATTRAATERALAQTQVPRHDVAFMRAFCAQAPDNAVFVTADPPVFIVEGRAAVSVTWAWEHQDRLTHLLEADRPVYLVETPSSRADRSAPGAQARAGLRKAFGSCPVIRHPTREGAQEVMKLSPGGEPEKIRSKEAHDGKRPDAQR